MQAVNVLSPIVNVPLRDFALGTLLGCLPQQTVAVRAGTTLGSLQSLHDLMDARVVAVLFLAGLALLVPSFLHSRSRGEGSSAGASATAKGGGAQKAKAL